MVATTYTRPFLLFSAALSCLLLAACNDSDSVYKSLQAALPIIDAQSARIRAELSSLPTRTDIPVSHWSRQWCGEYYVGDGLGTNIRINIGLTEITITNHGCAGLYGGNYGSIISTLDMDGDTQPDGVKVKWARGSDDCDDYTCETLYFIQWDGINGSTGRRYLVPESKMSEFVKNYNFRGQCRDDQFSAPLMVQTLADGTSSIHKRSPEVIGLPHMPAPWCRKLRYSSSEATITDVISRTTSIDPQQLEWVECRVKIDRGSNDGLAVATIIALDRSAYFGKLTIDKVTSDTAEGTYHARILKNWPSAFPAVGQIISIDERRPRSK